jgi:hypothetical protein
MQTKTMKETKTMKTKLNHQLVAAVGLLFTLSLQPSTLLAQGSLTPPGAPAPTMKTLQQVEPRVPISSAPFTITQPGSYYLTTNLTVSGGNAITITTNGVTLDLNGFTISSTTNPASGTAVLIGSGLRNIAIQNGHIQGGVTNNGSGVFSGPGFGFGIYYTGFAPQNVRVSGVSVSGCLYDGIYVGIGASTTVENCVVRTVGGWGILASTIRGCVALDCGYSAIYGQQVSDSRGEAVNSYGLFATTAHNCYGSSGNSYGLFATTAHNCYGSSGNSFGLSAHTAQNCYGYSGSNYGLFATTAHNCSGFSGSGYGLYAERTAIGCSGSSVSGTGLYAFATAIGCYGVSSSGTGLYASGTAIACYGYSSSGPSGLYALNANTCTGYRSGGRAIEATIANGCWAGAGTNLITYKYNMP